MTRKARCADIFSFTKARKPVQIKITKYVSLIGGVAVCYSFLTGFRKLTPFFMPKIGGRKRNWNEKVIAFATQKGGVVKQQLVATKT